MLSSRHTLPIASRLAFAFSLFLLPFAPPYQGPGSRCSEEAAPLRSTITISHPLPLHRPRQRSGVTGTVFSVRVKLTPLRSGPKTTSRPSRQKQFPSSRDCLHRNFSLRSVIQGPPLLGLLFQFF